MHKFTWDEKNRFHDPFSVAPLILCTSNKEWGYIYTSGIISQRLNLVELGSNVNKAIRMIDYNKEYLNGVLQEYNERNAE